MADDGYTCRYHRKHLSFFIKNKHLDGEINTLKSRNRTLQFLNNIQKPIHTQ